jgi:hypothetical protein
VTAQDADDVISINISGVPSDASLSAGTKNLDGSWTLTPDQLNGLQINAGEDTTATLMVTAINTEDVPAWTSQTIALTVNAVPEAPSLAGTATSVTVTEDGSTALSIMVTPQDSDDIVSINVSGLPADASLSAGHQNADGCWTLTPDQLAGLQIFGGEETTATLTVTATNSEGVPASATQTIALNVVDVPPTLSANITGTAKEGSTFTANAVANDDDATFTYQWQSSSDGGSTWTAIAGATAQTYQLQEGDETKLIDVVVTSHDAGGTGTTTTSAATGPVLDNSSLSIALSVVNNAAVAEGQQLVATPTIGDSDDGGAIPSYQWQSSSDGGLSWQPVGGATISGNQSFYQITEADEGRQFRVTASFTDDTGQLVSTTSNMTVKAADVTPLITPQFSLSLDELSIVKNGGQIYDDTFSQAPPQSPTISGNAVNYITLGSTWTDVGGKAILSSSGTTLLPPGPGVLARLTTNTDPTSASGLKQGSTFTVAARFDLVAQPVGAYGLELTDAVPTHANDQDVQIKLTALSNGSTRIGLYQADFTQTPPVFTLLGNVDLTPAQLAGANQIEFDLMHNSTGSTAISGQFKLLNNGTVLSTTAVSGTGSIFTSGVNWTRADVFGSAPSTVLVGGSAQEGQTLTANAATNDSDATLHYQWQSSSDGGTTWNNISGATSSTYTLQETDENLQIRVNAFTTDGDNNATASVFSTPLTIAGVSDAPNLTAATVTGVENTTFGLNITTSNQPGDAGDTLSMTITGVPSGWTLSGGSATNLGNGTWSVNPSQLSSLQITPATNVTGTFTLTANSTSTEEVGGSSATTSLSFGVIVAAPSNLLANAGFETGNFSGWSVDGSHTASGVFGVATAGQTIPSTTPNFGTDTVAVRSGSFAAYGDVATSNNQFLRLSQSLFLPAGTYSAGFYETVKSSSYTGGYGNSSSISLDGATVGTATTSIPSTGAFTEVTGSFTLGVAGTHTITFTVDGSGTAVAGVSADDFFLIDPPASDIPTATPTMVVSGNSVELSPGSNNNVAFASGTTGALQLDSSASYSGNISGFTDGDAIDFSDLVFGQQPSSQYVQANGGGIGTLTVGNATEVANLTFVGDYSTSAFVLGDDGHGGSLLTTTSGDVTIANGGQAELTGASAQSVAFAGSTGTLVLDNSTSFTGKVVGLTGDDGIDFADIRFGVDTKASFAGDTSGGVLTVTDGTDTAHITLVGDYTHSGWNLFQDAGGGTRVVDPPLPPADSAPLLYVAGTGDPVANPSPATVGSGPSLPGNADSNQPVTYVAQEPAIAGEASLTSLADPQPYQTLTVPH